MTNNIKEVQSDNIEYIKDKSSIYNPIHDSVNIDTDDNDLSNNRSGPSVVEVIGIMMIMLFIVAASLIAFESIKGKQKLNYAITENVDLYSELLKLTNDNSIHTTDDLIRLNKVYPLTKNNFKSVWGGKIEPSIEKSGAIKVTYAQVPVEYCKSFIFEQKAVNWDSVSISDNKDTMKVVNYKNEQELSSECNKYKKDIYITFQSK